MTAETIVRQFGYKAERDAAGVLTIKSVPIFVECSRGEVSFDAEWISAAVLKAKQAEAEGYLPPLHVRHHEDGPSDSVRAAGFFRITGTRPIVFKGQSRLAILADLVITDQTVGQEILAKRLPYRSVEIFDVTKPAIDSLALLDHEAPYLELPMLMVGAITETGSNGPAPVGVASATFANPWRKTMAPSNEGLVACFRRGSSAHLLYQDTNMNHSVQFEAEPKKDGEKKDEKMQDGTVMDVAAIVKAIKDGTITVADMDAILAAIAESKGAAEVEVEKPEAPAMEKYADDKKPATAAVPGAAMKAGDEAAVRMARLQGELEATKFQLAEREAADRRRQDVAAALKTLDGRRISSDPEADLIKFHKDHGPAAFAAYVESMAKSLPALPTTDRAAVAFAGQMGKAPEVAMSYVAEGADAVALASRYAAEWREMHNRGLIRMSEERYVQTNMKREGFKNARAN